VSSVSKRDRLLIGAVVLLTALAALGRYLSGVPEIVAFVIAALALAGQATIVSNATEDVGRVVGPAVTGTLQSTVGNLPEFFVVIFALEAGDRVVAQTAILGSIFTNALFLLGLVLVAGSWKAPDGRMRFSPRLPNDTATLLLVASFIIVLLGLSNSAGDAASHHARTISIVGASILLVVYSIWLRQYLLTGSGATEGADRAAPGTTATADAARAATGGLRSVRVPIALLVSAGLASAFTSDWFVHALEPTITQLHISQAFAGLVIVALAGNAVEHVVAVVLALRGQNDLAISVVKSSVAQVAAFMYPALVLISLALKTQLSFQLEPIYIGALFGTAILVWQVTGDGEATPFEGAALIGTFVALATVVAFEN
jgi:Ca2+:H+ antiporter